MLPVLLFCAGACPSFPSLSCSSALTKYAVVLVATPSPPFSISRTPRLSVPAKSRLFVEATLVMASGSSPISVGAFEWLI